MSRHGDHWADLIGVGVFAVIVVLVNVFVW